MEILSYIKNVTAHSNYGRWAKNVAAFPSTNVAWGQNREKKTDWKRIVQIS